MYANLKRNSIHSINSINSINSIKTNAPFHGQHQTSVSTVLLIVRLKSSSRRTALNYARRYSLSFFSLLFRLFPLLNSKCVALMNGRMDEQMNERVDEWMEWKWMGSSGRGMFEPNARTNSIHSSILDHARWLFLMKECTVEWMGVPRSEECRSQIPRGWKPNTV